MSGMEVRARAHHHIGWMREKEKDSSNDQKAIVWQRIDQLFFSERSDAQMWWKTTGYVLAVLLHQARYTTESQYRNLIFFAILVTRELGPSPNRVLSESRWKSFMTDDHMPIELSWEWGQGNDQPSIRYSIEPVGPNAGTSLDPFNRHAGAQLARRLGNSLPEIDLAWFQFFSKEFLVFDGLDGPNAENHESRFFTAFDLHERDVTFKAYFFPGFKAMKTGRSKLDCVSDALARLPGDSFAGNHAFDILRNYMSSPPVDGSIDVEILAIDCVAPAMSRVKIYARSRLTSFDSVKSMMTLAGRLNSPETAQGLGELEILWNLLFGADHASSEELRHVGHRTAGILYNFEIKPGRPLPVPKIYIPVRHYFQCDLCIMEALCTYLQRRGKNSQSVNQYVQAMKTIL